MKVLLILTLVVFLNASLYSQDTLIFDIKAGNVTLGEVYATQKKFKSDSICYRFESRLKVFKFYNIHYLMETVFLNDTLIRSLAKIDVNDKNHHFSETNLLDSVYKSILQNGDTLLYTQPILTSVTPCYFNNYNGPDTIFSEYSSMYRPFLKKNDSLYILHPNDPMEFYFQNGHIVRVTVPNSILDFHIELKTEK